jgi:hypothetical protein
MPTLLRYATARLVARSFNAGVRAFWSQSGRDDLRGGVRGRGFRA